MTELFSLMLNGLSVGSVYALVALGMVIVFKATELINFAHPGILVIGTLVAATMHERLDAPFVVSAGSGIAAAVVVGLLIDRVLVRPFQAQRAMLAAGIMTIGLSIIIDTLTTHQIGSQILSTGDPWGSDTTDILGVRMPSARVAAFVVAVVLLVGFRWWIQRSSFGLSMRAAADDPETAQLMGISLSRISIAAWAIASTLAVVAGVFLVSYPSAGLDVTVTGVALQAIPAVVIGGIDSTTGAVVGGLAVGVIQVLTLGYQDELAFLGRSFSQAAPYLVMLIVLLVRPAGLFGTTEVSRV